MATRYVIRHRGANGEARAEDLRKERESRLLYGLNHTGIVLDRQRPYERQSTELRGIQNRIDRIRRGEERVK